MKAERWKIRDTLTRQPHQLARNTDPATSHAAAHVLVHEGAHGRQQDVVRDLLEKHPGCTYRELFRHHSLECFEAGIRPVFLDAPSLMRRLSEVGRREGTMIDPVTGRNASMWWPDET